MERKLKLSEMADRLGLSPAQLNTRTQREAIPHIRLGRNKLFDGFEVMRHLGLASSFPQDRPREFFTYLIWAKRSRFYKIGMALDPCRRLRELSTGSPFELQLLAAIPYRLVAERDLHQRYKDRRRNGEWFEFLNHQEILPTFAEWTADYYFKFIGGQYDG